MLHVILVFMPWLFFVLLSVVLYAVASILQRVLMKDHASDPHTYSIVFQLLGSVLLFLYALTQGFTPPPLAEYPLNFLLLAALYGTGTLCLFNALKYIGASEVTIINAVRSVVTILAAIFFLNEQFTLAKGIGTLLIVLSVILITERSKKTSSMRGYLYALGMALCFGLAITNDAYIINHADVYSFAAVGFLLPGLFLIAVRPTKVLQVGAILSPKLFHRILIMTIVYVSAVLSFYVALDKGAPVSQATPILQSSVIITVLLAAVFLNERLQIIKKYLGAMLVIIGVLLISL